MAITKYGTVTLSEDDVSVEGFEFDQGPQAIYTLEQWIQMFHWSANHIAERLAQVKTMVTPEDPNLAYDRAMKVVG